MIFPDGTVKEGQFENNVYIGNVSPIKKKRGGLKENSTEAIKEEDEGEEAEIYGNLEV